MIPLLTGRGKMVVPVTQLVAVLCKTAADNAYSGNLSAWLPARHTVVKCATTADETSSITNNLPLPPPPPPLLVYHHY